MKDRVSTYPNRVLIRPDSGTSYYATLELDDAPIEEGTALNKANLLSDNAVSALGIERDNPTPSDAFEHIGNNYLRKEDADAMYNIGDTIITARTDMDDSWLLCDGSDVPANSYPKLYEVLPPTVADGWTGGQLSITDVKDMAYHDGIYVAACSSTWSTGESGIHYTRNPSGVWDTFPLYNCSKVLYINGYWFVLSSSSYNRYQVYYCKGSPYENPWIGFSLPDRNYASDIVAFGNNLAVTDGNDTWIYDDVTTGSYTKLDDDCYLDVIYTSDVEYAVLNKTGVTVHDHGNVYSSAIHGDRLYKIGDTYIVWQNEVTSSGTSYPYKLSYITSIQYGSWHEVRMPDGVAPHAIAFGDGLIITVTLYNCYKSVDGINYVSITAPSSPPYVTKYEPDSKIFYASSYSSNASDSKYTMSGTVVRLPEQGTLPFPLKRYMKGKRGAD